MRKRPTRSAARRPGRWLVVCLLLWACTPPPATPMRLGTNIWPGYEPFYLARSLGNLPDHQVRLVELSSATHVMNAFQAGAIDAAALTLDEALLLRRYRPDLIIVLVLDISHGADAIMARPEFPSLTDLRGRRVGVEHTALGAYLLNRALEIAGMTERDLVIVPLGHHLHQQAYLNGEVDAVVTFEPVKTALLEAGAISVFDTGMIPGEVVDVLVTTRANVQRFGRQLDTLFASWFASLGDFEVRSAETAALLAPRLQTAPEQVWPLYQGLQLGDAALNQRLLLSGASPRLLQTVAQLQPIMVSHDLLDRPVDIDDLIDPRPLKAWRAGHPLPGTTR